MFTWISRSCWLLALLVVSGCQGLQVGQPADRAVVAGKDVVIAGPPGFCVDSSATRDDDRGAFVLLGSCASIANDPGVRAAPVPAVLTAFVSAGESGGISGNFGKLRDYFASEEGRASLATDGNPASVRILDVRGSSDAIFLRARDTSAAFASNAAPDYWRGFLDVRGRIVTITVIGFRDRPITARAGLQTLEGFADRIVQASAAPPEAANVSVAN